MRFFAKLASNSNDDLHKNRIINRYTNILITFFHKHTRTFELVQALTFAEHMTFAERHESVWQFFAQLALQIREARNTGTPHFRREAGHESVILEFTERAYENYCVLYHYECQLHKLD